MANKNPMENKVLWIFLHPPRTGGGTLFNTLLKRVPKDEILSTSRLRYKLDTEKFDKNKIKFMVGHATYYGIHKIVPNKEPRYFIFLRDPAERIVSDYNLKMINEETPMPFGVWYKNQIKNEMTHVLDLKFKGSESTRIHTPKVFMPLIRKMNYKTFYFVQSIIFKIFRLDKSDKERDRKKLENAKKLLDLCWFIVIIEKSDHDIPFLLNKMGIKKVKLEKETLKKKVLIPDEKLKQQIYHDNPEDLELYRY